MSVVYLAINERANKTWAVKEVRKDGVMDYAAVRQSLMVETDLMKRLKHPNLPSIVDIIDADDSFIIVMDYIEGFSLQKLLKAEGAQPEERVVQWGRQLCDVLGYLHRQNPPIIYRDMKPANIMLKPDGNIALIDFGTAREFKSREMAEDTSCLGTRGYAAPEQYGGRGQTDARTDIFCLGATLYHLLTGRSPAEPPFEIKPLSYWITQYEGSGLEKLILKCTRQDPAERYQNCEELMYALNHYTEEDDENRRKRRRRIRTFASSCMVGLIALAGMLFFRNAWNGTVNASYDSLLEKAKYQNTFEEAQTYFLSALEMDAAKAEAYEGLIEKAGTEITKEDKLTPDTARLINECLTKTTHGNRTNLEVLKNENPEEYAKLMYVIGLWYFFMKGNTDQDRQTAAANYFSKLIQEEQYLSCLNSGQQEMTRLMGSIGGYIGELGTRMGRIGTGTDSNYSALFEDLCVMASGDLKSKVEKDYYCVAIYHQIAYWIDQKYANFQSDGVSAQQLNGILETVESGLESLSITLENDIYEEYTQALNAVKTAQKTISTRLSKQRRTR